MIITAILIICLVSLTPFPSLPLVIYYYSKFGFVDGFIVLMVASNLKIIIHYKIGALLRRKKINFFNLQDKILRAKEKYILSITENGFGKKTSHKEYRVTNRGGKGIIGIINSPRNGNIASSFPVFEGDEIMISTNKGRVIRVAVKEIRSAGRNTQGVRIIKLSGDEKVVSSIKIDDNLI